MPVSGRSTQAKIIRQNVLYWNIKSSLGNLITNKITHVICIKYKTLDSQYCEKYSQCPLYINGLLKQNIYITDLSLPGCPGRGRMRASCVRVIARPHHQSSTWHLPMSSPWSLQGPPPGAKFSIAVTGCNVRPVITAIKESETLLLWHSSSCGKHVFMRGK